MILFFNFGTYLFENATLGKTENKWKRMCIYILRLINFHGELRHGRESPSFYTNLSKVERTPGMVHFEEIR